MWGFVIFVYFTLMLTDNKTFNVLLFSENLIFFFYSLRQTAKHKKLNKYKQIKQ